ncbi:archease [Roseomonas eburnea]|uniref:Archease n=1 Tax=Neoroseomonas eburnea TaxID=1346889 RepID=A0A9X9XHC1_9PROT|nr:archease [Neoroseomonas eburnea]MBR0683107.1 archease [Neoroseomonas eburnea]
MQTHGILRTAGGPSPPDTGWEFLPHGADIGVRGWGPTREAAFEQAACALTHVVTEAEIRPRSEVALSCEAPDPELLFVAFLNAVIFEMAVRRMLFGRFHVAIDGTRLGATLWGEAVDVARHAPAVEPKGATLTGLHVSQDAEGRWSAACIVDV